MKKAKNPILAIVLSFVICHFQVVHAQVFDAFRGHIHDVKSRFSAHQRMDGQVLKKGSIDTNAKGQDLVHNSSGTWTLVRSGDQLYLQSGEDFRSSPGPDYHVYVSNGPAIKDNDEFGSSQIEVGRLKKPNGAAYYLLNAKGVDDIRSVLIWCKQFKEYIGSADLVTVKQ
jgi:hypothetical protein